VNRGFVLAASIATAVGAMAMGGCADDIDPPWQLDHDRIVAVRATPPGITSGQQSRVDALLAHKGAKTRVAAPEAAIVVSPPSLTDTLRFDGTSWVVTAPDETRLAAARAELKLAAGAPVPLQVGVSYEGQTLIATKTVLLGQAAENPALVTMNMQIDGQPARPMEIVVQPLAKVPLTIEADDVTYDVTWLTSCGTMHDFDLPNAYLKVEVDDPTEGELAVVLRDGKGGVAWDVWPIRAQ
jgi:hypothetical protein